MLFEVDQFGGAAANLDAGVVAELGDRFFKPLHIVANPAAHGIFRREALRLDQLLDAVAERLVFEGRLLGTEDVADVLTQSGGDALAGIASGRRSFAQRSTQAGDFVRNLLHRNGAVRDAHPLGIQHECGTDGDAGGDRDTAPNFHGRENHLNYETQIA